MSEGALPRVAVGTLASFGGRSGDLNRRHFSLLRGVEGIRSHQRVQRARGSGYRAEVPIRAVWEERLDVFGRIDGVVEEEGRTVIEEIKTTRDLEEVEPVDFGVHRLQARLYAWMWWRQTGELPSVRLVYVSPDDGREVHRALEVDLPGLTQEVDAVCEGWLQYATALSAWRSERDASLQALRFPFADVRPGQPRLMEGVEAVLRQGGRLHVQAPTGAGKTMALLVPALRAMGEGRIRRLFIATQRNTGKRAFAEAARLLVERGARIRVLTLVAKESVCRQAGSPCDVSVCPLARGFYDRLRGALAELRALPHWDADPWMAVAARHRVCPHAFLLHAVHEADVLLGDLNHAIDPSARLESWMTEAPERTVLLVDEAHHLPDRARAMLSASLAPAVLSPAWPTELRFLAGILRSVKARLREYQREALDAEGLPLHGQEPPYALADSCRRAAERLEQSFAVIGPRSGDPREDVIRELRAFAMAVERRNPSQIHFREGLVLHSLCRDVSEWLRDRLAPLHAVILCSATLDPLPEFRSLTGAAPSDRDLVLPSPFDPSHFRIRIEKRIPVVWRARDTRLYDRLALRIQEFLTEQPSKSLVFLPSFDMLAEIRQRLPAQDLWLGPVLAQPRGLQDDAAIEFLRPFRETAGPVTALAVLGGALNEGIDLPGDALNTVVIVSIGLPAVTRERELLRIWHQERGGDGFVMAYTLPGLMRVRQALGRVIRGPEDRGRALLIDPRFDHPIYRPYLAPHLRDFENKT